MKHVLITGATSFIGLGLIRRLLRGPYVVTAVVRPGSKKTADLQGMDRVRIVEADMENYRSLSSLIQEPVDIFFSLAWDGTRGAARNDAKLQEANYRFSMDALHAAVALGCSIVVSAGSQAEYGQYNCKIDETADAMPVTEYGKYKLNYYQDAYQLCRDRKIAFKESRFFSLYGEDDFEGTMIITMIKNMLANKDCHLTECVQMWDFLYISDAVEGLLALIEKPCADGVYNFGSGIAKPLKTFIEELYRLTSSSSKLLYGSVPYPETGITSIEPDISKLQRETGWSMAVSFTEGASRIIEKLAKC